MIGFVWFCIGAALGADVVMLIALNKFEEKSDSEKNPEKNQREDEGEQKARSPPAALAAKEQRGENQPVKGAERAKRAQQIPLTGWRSDGRRSQPFPGG